MREEGEGAEESGGKDEGDRDWEEEAEVGGEFKEEVGVGEEGLWYCREECLAY